jgi:hypothetical protein
MTTGASTVLASAESSTHRLLPGGYCTPSGNTPLLNHSVDHTSNNTRGLTVNFMRLFVYLRTSQTTRNPASSQHSW